MSQLAVSTCLGIQLTAQYDVGICSLPSQKIGIDPINGPRGRDTLPSLLDIHSLTRGVGGSSEVFVTFHMLI